MVIFARLSAKPLTVSVLTWVLAKAETLAGWHEAAMTEMKRVLWEGTDHWDALLKERAAISGTLVTKAWTRKKLAELKS